MVAFSGHIFQNLLQHKKQFYYFYSSLHLAPRLIFFAIRSNFFVAFSLFLFLQVAKYVSVQSVNLPLIWFIAVQTFPLMRSSVYSIGFPSPSFPHLKYNIKPRFEFWKNKINFRPKLRPKGFSTELWISKKIWTFDQSYESKPKGQVSANCEFRRKFRLSTQVRNFDFWP